MRSFLYKFTHNFDSPLFSISCKSPNEVFPTKGVLGIYSDLGKNIIVLIDSFYAFSRVSLIFYMHRSGRAAAVIFIININSCTCSWYT